MTLSWKKFKVGMACSLLIGSLSIAPLNSAFADGDHGKKAADGVQCFADQQHVGDGGKISYHIIYHLVENKNVTHIWLKVKVPEDLEVDLQDLNGAMWDEKNSELHWEVKENGNGAGVINFHLKAKKGAKLGVHHDISCSLDVDGNVVETTPIVTVLQGSQIDQPFFAGYPDGLFHPERSITRAEVASVISRIENLSDGHQSVGYPDVSTDHWAYLNINKVTNAGFMGGYPDGSFHPDDPISRAELVALVMRIRGIEGVPVDGFSDVQSHWAKDSINTAKALGWIHGLGNEKFGADSPVQRQVASVLVDTALLRGPLTDGTIPVVQHFPDVEPGDWSFGWVEESAKVAHESVDGPDGAEHLVRYLPDQTQSF